MMKNIIVLIALFGIFIQSIHPSFAYDSSNKNQGTVVESAKVDTSIPSRFSPMQSDNLNDWLNVLPDHLQKYRGEDQFMVIPAMGLITPIVELQSTNPDYKLATKGGNFDYNKYLIAGPTLYPGTAPVGKQGNSFIFAHSNYRHNKPGDFKTIFRLTYNIEQGDIIRFYKKENNKRTQYTYTVTKSMLVNETDIRVMLPEKGKTEVTLSACRPIGTAKQRWINRASLTSTKEIDYTIDGEKKINSDKQSNTIRNSGEQQNTGTTSTGAILTGSDSGNGSGTILEYKPNIISNEVSIAVQLATETVKIILGDI